MADGNPHGTLGHHDGVIIPRGQKPVDVIGKPTDENQHLFVCPNSKQHFRLMSLEDCPTTDQVCCPDGHWIYYES